MFNGITDTISVGGERTAADWYARLLDRVPDARPRRKPGGVLR